MHPESTEKMCYHMKKMQEVFNQLLKNDRLVDSYDDIFCGSAYINRVADGTIQLEDMLLMILINGAQLFKSKESDFWIYIWVILELSPDHHYKKKHVLLGVIIPGPKKPKFIESFLFPGLHHFSAQ